VWANVAHTHCTCRRKSRSGRTSVDSTPQSAHSPPPRRGRSRSPLRPRPAPRASGGRGLAQLGLDLRITILRQWTSGSNKPPLDFLSSALRFRGQIDVDDMALVLGIPLELSSVDGVDLELALEGETLRARASVVGRRGLLAGRQLDDVRMQVAYADPRLSFTALDGRFEGARISSSTGDARSSSPSISRRRSPSTSPRGSPGSTSASSFRARSTPILRMRGAWTSTSPWVVTSSA